MRIACFLIPLFPLAARLRSEPELVGEAAAVCTGNGNAARVVAATRPARQAGVRAGMSLTQARALLPDLIARGRDDASERAAQEALLEVAGSFSPQVESREPGAALAEISGTEHLFPGDRPEHDLGQAATVAAETIGLPIRVGIASSTQAARIAAELPDSPTVVPAGHESTFLAPLPLHRLTPELRTAERLERWGVRTVGDFARLPAAEVTSRLGDEGRLLHQAARGVDPRPLVPHQPPARVSEGMVLEWPVATMEPFLAAATTALERIQRRLLQGGVACRCLEIDLELEPEGHHCRTLELPAPTSDVRTLLELLRLDLEAHPPGAPVAAFTCTAHPDRPRQAQLTLFGAAELHPDTVATTLARLSACLGPERVGSPRVMDGHLPERYGSAPYEPPSPPKVVPEDREGHGLLAVRVLRPPVELEVISEGSAETASSTPDTQEDAQPLSGPFRLASVRTAPASSGNGGSRRLQIQGLVRVAAGPWTVEDGWWSEAPVDREYWDVELSDGGLYRIYRNRRTGDWYADGVYD
jgi:protein ImuB